MGPAIRLALERAGISDRTKSSAGVAKALDQVLDQDPELRRDVERDIAIQNALRNPLIDFAGFGGRRGSAMTAMPLTGPAEADVERAAAALGIASEKLLATSKSSLVAARGDFRRGAPLAKSGGRSPTATDLADQLEELAQLLTRDPDY